MEKLSEVIKNMSSVIEPWNDTTVAVSDSELCNDDCELCHGTGWVKRITESIYDPNFGKLFPCPNSDPIKRYRGIMNLFDDDFDASWDDIANEKNVMEAVDAVRDTIARGYGWVFLWGNYGLAKTMILKIATVEYVKQTRLPASYVRMAEIIDHLRGAYDTTDPSTESAARLDMWADLPMLSIDEFDRVRSTEYSVERRFVLMDRRYIQACRERSITLMASNTDPAKMEGYLSDRIMDGRFKVIHLVGESARPGL